MKQPGARSIVVLVTGLGALAACGGGARPGTAARSQPSAGAQTPAPAGYIRMQVADVHEQGIVLAEPGTGRYLPIVVAQEQALAVSLRMKKQRYGRPLTHDLLDRIVDEMGGQVEWVQIVRLEGTTFIG